jgi:hypothetical protein
VTPSTRRKAASTPQKHPAPNIAFAMILISLAANKATVIGPLY